MTCIKFCGTFICTFSDTFTGTQDPKGSCISLKSTMSWWGNKRETFRFFLYLLTFFRDFTKGNGSYIRVEEKLVYTKFS